MRFVSRSSALKAEERNGERDGDTERERELVREKEGEAKERM